MRLLLGDDHRMFLEALSAGLEQRGHEVIGSVGQLDGLVEIVERQRPDLCILDVDFAGRSVLGSVAAIRSRAPNTVVVLLTAAVTADVWAAYEQGLVDGVVNKLCDIRVLIRAIERTRSGERVVERFERPRAGPSRGVVADRLSRQEHAVLDLLVRGASTEQIAVELGVSTHTVRSHIQGVFHKLGVNSRAKAARAALAMGATGPAAQRHAG